MADGQSNQDKNSWESWLGGWVQTAKEKSSTALEFVKKDLAEFTCTMQKETEKAVEKTIETLNKEKTTQATNKVKAGFSSFLDNITKVLVIPPDDDYVQMKVAADGSGLYDRGKARLHAIQLDAATYMDPPKGPPEQYSMWLESFDMDQHKGEISELLVSKVEVRALYTKLVPGEVSHAEFWQRYFYRVHQLECDEARKQALMKRAEQARGDSLSWDDEEDWSGEEEDHQSDWEKLARPPQSLQAAQKVADPGEETEPVETQPTIIPESEPAAEIMTPTTSQLNNVSDAEKTKSKENYVLETVKGVETLNTTEPTKDTTTVAEDVKQSPITEAPSQPPEVIPTPELAEDLSSLSHLHQPPPAELWSLHIPEDGPKTEDSTGDSTDNCIADFTSTDTQSTMSTNLSDITTVVGTSSVTASIDPDKVFVPAVPSSPSAAQPSQELIAETPSCQQSASPEAAVSLEIVQTPNTSASVDTSAIQGGIHSAEPKGETCESATEIIPQLISPEPEKSEPEASQHKQEPEEEAKEINMSVKGDMVVIGERISPSSDNSDSKELGQEDDWEQDFDIEITEEDLKAADNIAKKLSENLNVDADDWENWE